MESVNPSTDCNMVAAKHRKPTEYEDTKFSRAFQHAFETYSVVGKIIPLMIFFHENSKEKLDELCQPLEGRNAHSQVYNSNASEIARIMDLDESMLQDDDSSRQKIVEKIRSELVKDSSINRAFLIIEVDVTVVDTQTWTKSPIMSKMIGGFWYEIGKPILSAFCPLTVSQGRAKCTKFNEVSEIVDGNLFITLPHNIRDMF